MSLNTSKISYHPAFKTAGPKVNNAAKKTFSENFSKKSDNLINTMSIIGWAGLLLAFVGSMIYGAVNAFSKDDAKQEQTEIEEQSEKIFIDELTSVFDETI